jgi:adenylate kinase family enzyme
MTELVWNRIGITGAPGSGVTTLGRALATRIGAVAIDTDDHYWVATDPPYREKRTVADRLAGIGAAQRRTGRWVLSGTLDDWAEPALAAVELIVFLEAPTEVRIERLRGREAERFGEALLPGGAVHEIHREFIAWAARYDSGSLPGRSRPRHEKWLERVSKPVLRLDGTRPVTQLVEAVLAAAPSG